MPQQLSEQPNFVWKVPLAHAGLGGIAATDKHVLFGDRDADDFQDVYRCLDANSGELIWEVERLAIAALDYGNSPRATPIISGERVYFHGAHGHLLCVQLADGQVVWEKNFRDDFPLDDDLPWGYCGSPLLIDGTLIVAAGAKDASVIALNAATGKLKWKSPGIAPGYGSLNVGTLGGVKQIVGHDAKTIGGWDPDTGKRLWTITPISDGDFNVPTPIIWDGKLILVTENNGCRIFEFDTDGNPNKDPIAVYEKLRSDMCTPVVVGPNLFCVKDFLYCLDLENDLAQRWRLRDKCLGAYASLIASDDRLLVIGKGELLLLSTDGSKEIISRQRVFSRRTNLYSHPAIVGNRLYLRGENQLVCLEL